jgi:hypothetical protein
VGQGMLEERIESPIKVYLRLRPLNAQETNENQRIYWKHNDSNLMEETHTGHKAYRFHKCFGYEENNRTIYSRIGKQLVLKAMEGYHGTLIACKSHRFDPSHVLRQMVNKALGKLKRSKAVMKTQAL